MSENKQEHQDMDNELQDKLTENGEQTDNTPTEADSEVEQLKAELADTKDKYMRLFAEFDNYKRRSAKELIEMRQTASKDLMLSLLSVMDDIDRSNKMMEETADLAALKEGTHLLFNKFKNILNAKGLKEMEALNQEFDADQHEAIANVPAPSEDAVGKVLDVLEKGYYLNDKLIRHAKVVVGN